MGLAAVSARPATARNEFIQSLRFVAAALVLLTHTTFYYHERINPAVGVWHGGETGVPIFFVISGVVMVMSSVMLASNAAGAGEFMSRRLLRILPLYWLVTALKVSIALAVPAVVNHNHFDLVHAVKSFLFIPAFNAAGEIRPIHGVGWTLLHEMFFYVVFAAMMLLGARPARWASALIVALYGLGLAISPQSAFMQVATSPINLYFVLGMAVGSAAVRGGPRSPAALTVTGLLLFAALGKAFAAPADTAWLPLDPLVLLLSGLMLLLSTWRLPTALKASIALGESSYALYLFHPLAAPPVLMVVHKFASGLGAVGEIALTVVITVGLGHAIHLWLELPLNRWVRRIFRRRAAAGRTVGETA